MKLNELIAKLQDIQNHIGDEANAIFFSTTDNTITISTPDGIEHGIDLETQE